MSPSSHQLTGDDVTRYMLAGHATVSILNRETGNRFTFKISMPRTGDQQVRFVRVLTGVNNETHYRYLGYIREGIYSHGYRKAQVRSDAQSNRVFDWVWSRAMQGQLPEAVEIWHSGACGRCGRTLTDPYSIETGIGPVCRGKIGEDQA